MRDLRVYDRISDAVGWTPLVRRGPTVAATGCEVFAKIEAMNPMGSTKDRIARHMVAKALADGRLAPDGGVIVEASSGNTGMGLAMMALLHGVRCRLVIRRETSHEKLDALRALGAELVLVPGDLPPDDPESYNRKATQVAAETPGAWFPDQHQNRENNEAHYLTTGPEIWEQMEGRLDVLVAGIGTGGTASGAGRYLKERDPSVRVVAVDVVGSVFTEWFHHKRVPPPSRYRMEGLGDEEITGCPEFEVFDDMVQAPDREAFLAARELARGEAIFAGGSSGAALWGVRQVAGAIARKLGRPARIATVFPDSGFRYLSTIYSDEWMRANGYLEAEPVAPR